MVLSQVDFHNLFLNILFYLVIGSLGAFIKDWYDTMMGRSEQIRIGRIIVGGIVSTVICFGLQEYIFKDLTINTIIPIVFVMGVLGFEIFGNITTIGKLWNSINRLLDARDVVRGHRIAEKEKRKDEDQ